MKTVDDRRQQDRRATCWPYVHSTLFSNFVSSRVIPPCFPILLHIQSTPWPLSSTAIGPDSRSRFPSKPSFSQAPLNARPHVKCSPNPGTIDKKAHVTDHTHPLPMCLLVNQSPSSPWLSREAGSPVQNHGQSMTEEIPPPKGLLPTWCRSPLWSGQGYTPSQYFTAYDDRWQRVRTFQTSPPPVSIVIKFRRSPAWRPGSTQAGWPWSC